MGFITAVTDVQDANGASLVPLNADGTRPNVSVQIGAGLSTSVTRSADAAIITISAPGSPTVTDLVVSGTITQGPAIDVTGGGTDNPVQTIGSSTAIFIQVQIPSGTTASATYRLSCNDGDMSGAAFGSGDADAYVTLGGSGSVLGAPMVNSNFAITPRFTPSWDPDTETLTFTAQGPLAQVTGISSNGDMPTPHVRLTLSNEVTSAINLQSVTVAGGTTEANGAHVATFIDAGHVDLLSVAYTDGSYSGSGASMRMTTAQTVNWAGWAKFVRVPKVGP